MPSPKRHKRGTLVLEALLAGVMFASCIAVVAAISAYHQRALVHFQDRNAATFLAEREMEELLAQGFSGIPHYVLSYPQVFSVKRRIDSTAVVADYRCEITYVDSPNHDLRTVVVSVFYPEDGREKQVRLETDVYWTE